MNILIADDETLARQRLDKLLGAPGFDHTTAHAANGYEVLQRCSEKHFDLVLLDIRMPEMDGIETAKRLQTQVAPPAIVFITAYEEHALEAFEACAVDYLVKPVRRERLEAALAKVRVFNQGRQPIAAWQNQPERSLAESHYRKRIVIPWRGELISLAVEDIRFFRADQKYVEVATEKAVFLMEASLKQLEDEFAGLFVRIHRNALVAIDSIVALSNLPNGAAELRLEGIGLPLAVSRRHLAGLKALLKNA